MTALDDIAAERRHGPRLGRSVRQRSGARSMTQASRTLTAATLVRLGACPEQVALFRATFGDSVEVTPALTAEHVDAYKWSWAADHLLSHAARDAYRAAMLSASDAYYAAVASASDAFDAAVASARDAYRAAMARAWAEAYVNDPEPVV